MDKKQAIQTIKEALKHMSQRQLSVTNTYHNPDFYKEKKKKDQDIENAKEFINSI